MIGQECPEDTAPGHQQLAEVNYYDIQTGCPAGHFPGNARVGWSYVDPLTGRIVVIEGNYAKAITSYPDDFQVIEILNGEYICHDPLEGSTGGDVLPMSGHSDEASYVMNGHSGDWPGANRFYYSWDNETCVGFNTTPPSWSGTGTFSTSSIGHRWVKADNSFYIFKTGAVGSLGDTNSLLEFNATTGVFVQEAFEILTPISTFATTQLVDMQATTDYIYMLVRDNTLVGSWGIQKVDRSTLAIVDTFEFDYVNFGGFRPVAMHVISDDLIYLLREIYDENTWEVGYYETATETYSFIDRVPKASISARGGDAQFWFFNGLIYLGSRGFSGVSVNITLLGPLTCPTPDNLTGGVLISFSDFETPDPLPQLALALVGLTVPDAAPQLGLASVYLQVPDPGASIEPCPNTETRYPTPALNDYILDCYDTGSYS